VLFLLCLALTGVGRSVLAEEQTTAALITQAEGLLKDKKYALAAKSLSQALEELPVDSPHCVKIVGLLRRAYDGAWVGQRFVTTVEKLLDRLAQTDLEQEARRRLRRDFLQALASYHRDHRQSLGAIRRYEEVRELVTPEEAKRIDWKLLGLYEEIGEAGKALAILEARMASEPENRSLRSRAARLCFRLGKADRGLELMGKRTSPGAIRSVAEQLFRAKCLPEAEALAREIADEDLRAKFLLAKVNFEQKKFEEAGRLLEECYDQEEKNTGQLANIAKKLAELHASRGTLDQFISERGEPVAGAKANGIGEQRKRFLLLSHLFEENGQFVDACKAYLSYCDLKEKKSQKDWRLVKLLRPAVHQLLGQGQTTEATRLVLLLREKGFAGPWLDCTDYVILHRTGQKEKAAALLEKLEAGTGATEAELYALISAFENWGRLDLCAKFCHRTLELKPDNSVYDSNAHIRLGRLHMQEGKLTEAQEHFDAVDASLTGRNMGIIGMEHFRRMEVYVRLRAAKDDPAVLVRLLDDPRPGRQIAAAQYLSQYGKTEQLAGLQARLNQGSPKLKAALQEAITNIRARRAAPAPVAKMLSDDELKELLGQSRKLLWLKADPFAPDLRWASLEKKFVSVADVNRGFIGSFSDAMEVLSDNPLTASAIAFTEQTVWVGTDHGLFVLQRKQQTWNGYAIGGKFVDIAVKELRVEKNSVVVDIEREGRRERYGLNPATGEWKKLSPEDAADKE